MKVDNRAGSKDLYAPLRSLGVTVEEVVLPARDVEIVGNGPGGSTCLVGIEVKTWDDALTCMQNGRFAEQARKMREYYDISWLLVYGRIKSERGSLAVWRGNRWKPVETRPTMQRASSWLTTMALRGGVLLWRCEDMAEACEWLRAQELWWTAQEWEDHRSHLDYYEAPLPENPYQRPSVAYRMAHSVPGLGVAKAERAAAHFKSAKKMALASEQDWAYIEGVGKKLAKTVVAELEREDGAWRKR